MRATKLVLMICAAVLASSLCLANAQEATPTANEIQSEIAQLRERILELEAKLPPTEMQFSGTGPDLGDAPFYLEEGWYRVTASCQGDTYAYFHGIPVSGDGPISMIEVQDSRPSDAPLNVYAAGEYFLNAVCDGEWQITIQPLTS